jgi:NADH dehydrogenase
MAATVLVVGGTGHLGAPVARRLLADGYEVRVLVRDPDRARRTLGDGFDYRAGDVGDDDAVRAALSGCACVHVSLGGAGRPADVDRVEHVGSARVAAIAATLGVDRVSFLSGAFVGHSRAGGSAVEQAKLAAERAIERSGVPFTVFRPTYFIDTLPRHLRGRSALVIGSQPHRLHMVAAEDYARMVSRALTAPEAANRHFAVLGPEAITLHDALTTYCAVLAPSTTVRSVPLWLMALANRLVLRGELDRTIQTMRLLRDIGEVGDPSETNRILGAPTITVRQWCQQRADAVVEQRRAQR